MSMLSSYVARFAIAPILAAALLGLVSGCGTTDSLGGNTSAPGTDTTVGGLWSGGKKDISLPTFQKKAGPNDRPTRVGWLSARASRCGFVFDPAQLRARYFAFEQSYGADPKRMQEIQRAYDYSLTSTAEIAKNKPGYCTKARVDEIRPELNQYLSGNFITPQG